MQIKKTRCESQIFSVLAQHQLDCVVWGLQVRAMIRQAQKGIKRTFLIKKYLEHLMNGP